MKKIILFFAIVIIALATGCASSNKEETREETREEIVQVLNICLVIDGTDRNQREQSIPEVDIEYLMNFVSKIQEKGIGTLYLTFIDDNADNNSHAYYNLNFFSPPKPPYIEPKKDYETKSDYDKQKNDKLKKYRYDSVLFENRKAEKLSVFQKKAQEIIDVAYSYGVANNRRGSDVNGAINAAIRLLRSNPNATVNYLILISDLVDNVKKPLKEIPDNVTIIMVNESVSNHQFGDRVTELANLEVLEDFLFK